MHLLEGDITVPGLGLSDSVAVDDVNEVWHLAAVYDLPSREDIAKLVNITGTEHVLQFCRERSNFRRLQYVSTCYVSGRYDGEFTEEMLEEARSSKTITRKPNTRPSGWYEPRSPMASGDDLPPRHRRGDSRTGETQKYDGPYFVADYMKRLFGRRSAQCRQERHGIAGPAGLRHRGDGRAERPDRSEGKTYQLTDPDPPSAREVAEIFGKHLHRRLVWLPIPVSVVRGLLDTVPGMELLTGLPAETLDYFAFPTTYGTAHTVADPKAPGSAAHASAITPTSCSTSWRPIPSSIPKRWSDPCQHTRSRWSSTSASAAPGGTTKRRWSFWADPSGSSGWAPAGASSGRSKNCTSGPVRPRPSGSAESTTLRWPGTLKGNPASSARPRMPPRGGCHRWPPVT